MKIDKNVKAIIGDSSFDGKKFIMDENFERIKWLVNNYLLKIASDGNNRTTLYQDPEDKRYWEMSYPGIMSEMLAPRRC